MDLNDATARAMRALGLYGSPRKLAIARKYTIGATAVPIVLPLRDLSDGRGERRPTFIKFNVPTAITALYAAWDSKDPALVPTTGADGVGELIDDQTIVALYGQSRVSLIAEGSGDVTISYIWC